jgi:hypothetical protein
MIMLFARKLPALPLFNRRRHPASFPANCRHALYTAPVVNALPECDPSALQASRAAHALLDGREELRIPLCSMQFNLDRSERSWTS